MGRQINLLVVHCTAGHKEESKEGVLQSFRARGWTSPGYHYLITLDGKRHQLLDEGLVSNGAKGHNANSIHIAYTGGVRFLGGKATPEDTRSPEQKASLRQVLTELRHRYPHARILGHRDLSPDLNGNGTIEPQEWIKACPCFDAQREYHDI